MTWHRSIALVLMGAVATVSIPQSYAQSGKKKLSGRVWTVVSVQDQEPVKGKTPTLSFDANGNLSGSGGCNRLTGTFKRERGGKVLSIAQVASTRMLCEGDVMRYERSLIASLRSVDGISFSDDGRALLSQNGKNVLVLK